jgi:hypothetical protein
VKAAFDFDDVLVDFVGAWLLGLLEERGFCYYREDIALDGWDMGPWANKVLFETGLGESYTGMDWLEWLNHPGRIKYWDEAETTPGALEALNDLASAGVELELLTNKPRWAHTVVWSWLFRTDAPFGGVRILNHMSKEQASDADILVDDRPGTIRKWEATGRTGILYARSQNASDRAGFNVAYDFADVVYAVQRELRLEGGAVAV